MAPKQTIQKKTLSRQAQAKAIARRKAIEKQQAETRRSAELHGAPKPKQTMEQAAATTPKADPVYTTRANVAALVPGTTVNELYVLSNIQVRQGGKTGNYLTFRLTDATGSVPGVYWPADAGEAESVYAELIEGKVTRIKGDVVSYRDRTEIRVVAPNGGLSVYQGTILEPEAFVPTSKVPERELRDAVEVRIGLIGDPHLRRLLRSFFSDKQRSEAYFRLPARLTGAHAHLRGLAEEAVECARISGAAAGSIPDVDRDLVTAAALMAPAGALLAYEEAGLSHEETPYGLLLPLHVLAADLVERVAKEAATIPARVVDRLRHVLLREPEVGRFGWSSGPQALLPETVVLHHALRMTRLVPEVKAALERKVGVVDPVAMDASASENLSDDATAAGSA